MNNVMLPDVLYHYCGLDTFYKIIRNKTLRLSDISKSNDSMEINWTLLKASKIFEKLYLNACKRGFQVEKCRYNYGLVKDFFESDDISSFVCSFQKKGTC